MWGMGTSLQPGSWGLLCPFCHHPDPAVPFPSVSHIPLCFSATFLFRGDFPREPRFSGFWFPCSLLFRCREERSQIGTAEKDTSKLGLWTGPWQGRCWPESKAGAHYCPPPVPQLNPKHPSIAYIPTSLTSPFGAHYLSQLEITPHQPGSLALLVPTFLILYMSAYS